METPELGIWKWAVEAVGFPAALLVFIIFASWRVFALLKPWAERLFSKHLQFLDRTEELLIKNSDEQRATSGTLLRIDSGFEDIHAELRSTRAETAKLGEQMARNTDATRQLVERLDRLLDRDKRTT
jgi:hypothetical protein